MIDFDIIKNKKSFKFYFSDHGKNGAEYLHERFDKNLKCDVCSKLGSWYVVNEKYKIGLCSKDMLKNYSNLIDTFYKMEIIKWK